MRVDSIRLSDDGADQVRIDGVVGEPPPPTLKVSLNSVGGFRNAMTFVLTGLDIDAKAELVQRQLEAALSVKPAELEWTLARTDHPDADTEEAASALLHCVVRDPDPANVGRQFSSARSRTRVGQLSRVPCHRATGRGPVYGVFTPGYVDAGEVPHVAVHADGRPSPEVASAADTRELAPVDPPPLPEPLPAGPTRRAPLGMIAGARSGDKGGSANVGVRAHRRAVALARAHADRREVARITAGDSRSAGHPPPAAQPAGGELRDRRHPRRGCRLSGPVRPQAKGAGRVADAAATSTYPRSLL